MGDFVYIDEISLCNKGRSRYMTNLASSHKFNVGDEFAATVCSLPGTYNNQTYMDFLQDWGTHVVMETEIGWEKKIRKRLAVADIVSSLIGTHPELLVPTGAARGQTSSVSLSKAFTDNPTYLDTLNLNSRMTTVSSTSKGSEHVSEPIKYKVVSIDEMLDAKYWQAPEDIVDEKLCSRGFENTLPVWRNNIQQALKAYAGYLQAPSPTDIAPSHPVSWPSQSFALLEPTYGCPTDNGPWETGSTTHTVCKRLQLSKCPIALGPRRLRFPDLVPGPLDLTVLPEFPADARQDLVQDLYTTVYKAIRADITMIHQIKRNDGSESAPIILPHQEPFYLYPDMRAKKCQKVLGMRSTDGWIRYPYTSSGSRCDSYHPYDEDCYFHKVHYCYYTKETTVSNINVVGRK
uniref:Uncharacterized protein n=1 Tax=Magallana gigas TaxID=29159 RepID=K1QQS3_MAGGI